MNEPAKEGSVSAYILETYEVFGELTRTQLDLLAQVTETREVAAGEEVFNERDADGDLFVVRTGMVNILLDAGAAGEVSVSTIGDGKAFGWSGFLAPHTYTATARATERTELTVIPAGPVRRLMAGDKDLAIGLLRAVGRMTAERLKETTFQLIGMMNN